MPFPLKFKDLIELSPHQVEKPTCVWLNYGVCASKDDSCGWQGWVIDRVESKRGDVEGDAAKVLPSDEDLNCPKCGNPLFRTEVNHRFELSRDQTSKLIPDIDYEVAPIVYAKNGEDLPNPTSASDYQ